MKQEQPKISKFFEKKDAIASSKAMGKPSLREGKINTFTTDNTSATLASAPVKITLSDRFISSTCFLKSESKYPLPTISNFRLGLSILDSAFKVA